MYHRSQSIPSILGTILSHHISTIPLISQGDTDEKAKLTLLLEARRRKVAASMITA
jgi:hypothetical protein